MPLIRTLFAAASILPVLLWSGAAVFLVRCSRQVRRLDEVLGLRPGDGAASAPPSGAPLPALTVVVTARDEAEGIEATVRGLLAQRYEPLEVVVVDDRSTDGTGAILDRLAAEAGGRLAVVHNTHLPQGWIGKCHACHLGAARARGAFILFMDGDVELLRPDLLARIAALAEAERIDHLAITPDTRPMSALQSAVMAVFGHLFLMGAYAHEIDRDRPRGGGGIGAFNMVRRSAYARVGGHALLKLDPGDDFKLGRLLKESGARQRLYDGIGLIRCPWHRGVRRIVGGLEKNFFAGFDYSVTVCAAFTLLIGFLYLGPLLFAIAAAAALAGGAPAPAALGLLPLAAQTATLAAAARVQVERQGGSATVQVLLYPLGAVIVLAALWNSAWRTLRRGGILWRDTFYPLADLRRGLVRRGAGRRFLVRGAVLDPPAGPLL
jgi:glycosyltransferase involved in cell wall biosynthesis